ncbi:molybdopterin-dependent oxidoreductase [Streptomyces sp. NPDC006875]|uniref:molybdopterin-dependent oxidoreductase n=1 Tax=Streptomyces sp. NPDC006875 TaxID=3154781 RepID=UPI0034046891
MRRARAALSGLLAGYAALAFAELVSAFVRPEAGPVVAVGSAAIDRTPTPVKDWAIRHFGTDDKLVLQLGILAALAALAILLGLLAKAHRRTGAAGVLVFGVVGAAAALSRPDSTGATDALPSVAGALTGGLLLYWLAGRPSVTGHLDAAPADRPGGDRPVAADDTVGGPATPREPGWDRRGFLLSATAAAAASTGAGALGRSLNGSRGRDAVAARDKVILPAPGSPATPVPRRAGLRIPGVGPFLTPTEDFYRVDTALVVPRIDATTWRLRVHGKGVTRPVSLSFDDLLRRELIERDITLTCVSNEVGGPYVGNARWIGVRLADLLAECGVTPPSKGGSADQLVARSVDGMTIGSPVDDVMDGRDALLAVGMNGRPLPFEHGFPVRMVVPGLYGYVSACKWIQDIELTTFDAYDPYWVKRDWARRAPIKTQSRIDTPKPFARPRAGTVMVAGVAWAQHRGVREVEVRVDDGPWQRARLAAEDTVDTWRQWSFPWEATKGGHTLTVRATDGTGRVQTALRTRTVPDGAGGRHSVVVTVD